MKLEEKLVVLRKQKGLSQLELAEMMRVSRQAVLPGGSGGAGGGVPPGCREMGIGGFT